LIKLFLKVCDRKKPYDRRMAGDFYHFETPAAIADLREEIPA